MEYKLIISLDKINAFYILNEKLYWIKDNVLYHDNDVINSGVDITFLKHIDNSPVYRKQGCTHYKDIVIEISLVDISNFGDFFLFSSSLDVTDFSLRFEIFNNFPNINLVRDLGRLTIFKSVVWVEGFFFLIYRNYILKFGLENYELDNQDFFNLNQIQNLDADTKIYEVVAVWQNLLIVFLSNFRLLALDKTTGELVHDLPLGEMYALEPQNYLSSHSAMHLDAENNRLIWLSIYSLIHIDLNTFESTLVKDFFKAPIDQRWRFDVSTLYNGKLYSTADLGMQYVVPTRLCVLDAETGDLEWHTQLFKTGGLSSPPKVTEDKLYVRSSRGKLFIFEKED